MACPADLAVFDPDEIERIVTDELGGSALFAARFRECAARALLLPRRRPDRRMPLWQQRQRAASLLSVASKYPSFPIVLETVRECLQDVFDVPGLVGLMRDLAARRVRMVEVETPAPSPFARSLLFTYVGAFMYEGDAPLAERRAQALTLDAGLLAELLGQADLRELLDPEVVAQAGAELSRLHADRRARSVEGVADLLRELGPLSVAEALERGATPHWLAELEKTRRAIRVRIAGTERWAAIEDAGRLQDALGVPPPVGVPEAFLEPVADPLGDLLSRHARTHAPFHAADVATRFGLGTAVVTDGLRRLAAAGRVVEGEFTPFGTEGAPVHPGTEWCDAGVLRMLRRRSLARLRSEVEPSPPEVLARFLPAWHHIGQSRLYGLDALVQAIEQLQGAAVPASALESLVLPARVPGYSPALLDELTAAGEVIWAGQGGLPGGDGWVSLYLADTAPLLMPEVADITLTPLHEKVLEALSDGGAVFFRTLSTRVGSLDDRELVTVVWDLLWAGHLTNDTLAPLRSQLGTGRGTHRPRARKGAWGGGRGRPAMPSRTGPPTVAGRWWLLPARETDRTRRGHAQAEALLERYGIVIRGAVAAERTPGGFAAVYPVLRALEESGSVRRGYFVDGLGAAQFALPGAVDRLRSMRSTPTRPIADAIHPAMDEAHYSAATTWTPPNPATDNDPWATTDPAPRKPPHNPANQSPHPSDDHLWATHDPAPHKPPHNPAHDPPPPIPNQPPPPSDSADDHPWATDDPTHPPADDTPWTSTNSPYLPVGDAPWATAGTPRSTGPPATEPARTAGGNALVLAATDPANVYGAALPWPDRPEDVASGHKPGRKAGALVVLVDGKLVLYVERGGKTLLSWPEDPGALQPAVDALALAVREGALGRLTVERADGESIIDSPLADALEAAGFHPTPRGLRLRA